MKFTKWIKQLEKKGIVSKWPQTWIPFAMAIILLGEGLVFPIEQYKMSLYYVAGFTLLYAIGHWKMVKILNRKP